MSNKKSNKTNKKNKKGSKNGLIKAEKIKFSQKHPKITIALRIILLLILIIAVIATGVVVGMIYGGWGDNFEITKEELVIGSSNSVILDKDGNKNGQQLYNMYFMQENHHLEEAQSHSN